VNLSREQQAEVERALLEIQDSKELTNLESSIRQIQRAPDAGLPIPQVVTTQVVRGAVCQWEPLPEEARINFYEVQISSSNVFATSTTLTTFDSAFVVDGLTSSQFLRVRGIRRDGTATPYSDTQTLTAGLFEVRGHSAETFYYKIEGDEQQTMLGGAGSDLAYQPINPNGESLVWGFMSVYADPVVGLYGTNDVLGEVVVTITDKDGILISEKSECSVTFAEYYNSTSLGPFTIEHPELQGTVTISLKVTDRTTLADGSARAADNSTVFWAHLNALELGTAT
jgi:hypothetical protein